MARMLIVNADDFNRSPGVSRGIVESHEKGIVTSTTVMVNLPGLRASLELLRDYPRLGVGLHVNLTFGSPVVPAEQVPSLVDAEGRFWSDPAVAASRGRPEEIRREVEAQIAACVACRGERPTHLDGHHHVHLYPPVQEIVAEIAARHHLPLRARTAAERQAVRRCGVRTSDHFVGDAVEEPYWTVERLLATLPDLPDGVTEMMCHPGYCDAPLAGSRYGPQREVERAALSAPEVRRVVEESGLTLCTFAALGEGDVP